MKFVHITDTHLVAPRERLYGLDPKARLDAAVADIKRHHADAELVVVTGDLTHWGEPEAYRSFVLAMRPLPMPWIVLVGNHDRRAECLDVLASNAPRDPHGFVQGVRDFPVARLVFLDTLNETSHAGQMCDKRLGWLAETLARTPTDKSLLIFMHHPPFEVGVHAMDRIALAERARFGEVIAPYRTRIHHLFFGPVHRPIAGSWQGIPFSTQRGTNHQVWFEVDPAAPHLASHEPPAYAIVLVTSDTVMAHFHDYLDQSARFPFGKDGVDDRANALGPTGS